LSLPPRFEHLSFHSIITDSRKIERGCLFVALKGDSFDGHDFIAQAIEKGAAGVISRKDHPAVAKSESSGACFFAVTDTLSAYREIAKAWRARFSIPLAMVAGSNGKTTTKELLYALLHGKWEKVLKTQGSQNGFVGIPMTLLELNASHQVAVIEVGIDEPGSMAGHVELVAPSVAVLTVIQPEHLEKLIDLKTVAHEEGLALSETLKHVGAIAVNCDDPLIAPHLSDPRIGRKLGYTLNEQSDDPAKLNGHLSSDFKYLEVVGGDFTTPERFPLPLPGRHNATNLLAAITVARMMGVSANEMRKGLSTFAAPEGRSQLRTLSDQTQVICDYYNSQPASLRAGLELLAAITPASPQSQRWACLADMLELGAEEERYHRDSALAILSLGIQNVFLYGKRMKWLESELKQRGFSGTLKHYETREELASDLSKKAQPGSVILIKGSNSMKMGEVWKAFEQQRK
jgi:UDP-N-acetylmuramoyl-tripeptide--D-alanyl-D-alanine ligase